jgi:aminoglycoside phosphotransferase (APT) family kinase protein
LTHKDIQPWNLLAREGRPVVLDWELSGMLDLSGELGSTALSLAKGPGFDDIQPSIFRSVLDGYVAGGGSLPPSGPSWFVFMIWRLAGAHEVEHPPLPRRCRGEHRP